MYDAIIIGAGPIGLTCAIEAKKNGLSYLVLEKGCLVNSLFNYPTNMVFFSTSERLEIGDVPFVSHGDKPTRRESLEYFRRVYDSWKLNINTYEEAVDIKVNGTNYSVVTSKNSYRTKNIIIATGFFDQPNMMNIPGEELPKVKHYFNEAHPYSYHNIIVVGGGNSAVDVALETYRRGSKVAMVIREDSLKEGVKYWVKPDIENRIKEGSITAYFNSQLTSIRDNEADIRLINGDIITVKNDFVLAMTGYHPDYEFLIKAGIEVSQDDKRIPLFNPDTFETNRKGIFLAGVVCGGMQTGRLFIENSRGHADKIIGSLKERLNLPAND